jgi:RND family efflux transporter MFP subunit
MSRLIRYCLPFLLLGACGTDEAAVPEAAPERAGGAITIWTDSTELFMEHPALIVGVPGKFAVHLTDITDFAPLRSGKITLRFTPRGGGEALVVVQEEPRVAGIYGPSPEFKAAGIYDLTIAVESPQARDTIRVSDLRVYATAEEAPLDEGGDSGGIPFLKEQQWKTFGFATAFATDGSVAETFPATGALVPAAGRMALVTAPLAGVIDPGSMGEMPVPGQRVSRGQVIGRLLRVAGDAGSALARARAELREAEDEQQRATRLFAAEAIPQRRLHEADIRLRAAREALAALSGGDNAAPDGRFVIRAPMSGVIAARTLTPGSRVEAGDELFTIVDPTVAWLQVNVAAADAARVGRSAGAYFHVPGSDTRFTAGRMISTGTIIDSVTRTIPVIYEVANPTGVLKLGMTVQVDVATGSNARGVVVPIGAILDEDGRPIAYVQPEGERFEKRALVLGGRSATHALVLNGISQGERVVTGAAYQVRLASLSNTVPAQGHAH